MAHQVVELKGHHPTSYVRMGLLSLNTQAQHVDFVTIAGEGSLDSSRNLNAKAVQAFSVPSHSKELDVHVNM